MLKIRKILIKNILVQATTAVDMQAGRQEWWDFYFVLFFLACKKQPLSQLNQ